MPPSPPTHTLARRALRAVLLAAAFLAAGAVCTVLLACLSALRSPPQRGDPRVLTTELTDGMGYECLRFVRLGRERVGWGQRPVVGNPTFSVDRPYDAIQVRAAREQLPRFEAAGLFPPLWGRRPEIVTLDQVGRRWQWLQEAHGWPMLALWCEWSEDAQQPGSMGEAQGGIDLDDPRWGWYSFYEVRGIPLRPIWCGLAFNSVVYAGGWIAVAKTASSVKRSLRRLRNLCPRAGTAGRG